MNIGFPVVESAEKEFLKFDESLHGSKFFGVYCTENESLKIVPANNIGQDNGMGIIQFLKNENIENIISPECYSMAAKIFADNQIGIYQAANSHVLDNIEKFLDNQLMAFGAETAIKKSSCSSDCSDCSSKCDDTNQDIVQI